MTQLCCERPLAYGKPIHTHPDNVKLWTHLCLRPPSWIPAGLAGPSRIRIRIQACPPAARPAAETAPAPAVPTPQPSERRCAHARRLPWCGGHPGKCDKVRRCVQGERCAGQQESKDDASVRGASRIEEPESMAVIVRETETVGAGWLGYDDACLCLRIGRNRLTSLPQAVRGMRQLVFEQSWNMTVS